MAHYKINRLNLIKLIIYGMEALIVLTVTSYLLTLVTPMLIKMINSGWDAELNNLDSVLVFAFWFALIGLTNFIRAINQKGSAKNNKGGAP